MVSGDVTDGTTGEPLAGAVIRLVGQPRGAVADVNGHFQLVDLPIGTDSLRVNYLGFEEWKNELRVVKGKEQNVQIALNSGSLELEPAIIESDAIIGRITMSESSLGLDAIKDRRNLTQDPFQALGSLPGVVMSTSPYLGHQGISVRGGDPLENLYLVDYAPNFWPFYFLGKSIFNEEAVEEIEVLSGGYPANFGHKMSSVIHFQTRDGNMDRHAAHLSKDIFNSNVRVEGPILKDKLSWVGTYRSSQLGNLVDPIQLWKPLMEDFSIKLKWKIGDRHTLKAGGNWGIDHLSIPTSEITAFQNGQSLGQHIQWQAVLSDKWYQKASLVHTRQQFKPNFPGEVPGRVSLRKTGLRQDFSRFLGPGRKIRVGWEGTTVNNECMVAEEADSLCRQVRGKAVTAGGYVLFEGKLSRGWGLNTGARVDRYSLIGSWVVSPRFAVTRRLGQKNELRFAGGVYHQEPDVLFTSADSKVKTSFAIHYVFGWKRVFDGGWAGWAEVYHKDYRRLLSLANGELPGNEGFGNATGGELTMQKKKGGFSGWANYSYSISQRQEYFLDSVFPTQYDQRHLFNLGFSAGTKSESPSRWRAAGSLVLRCHTGSPYTRIDSLVLRNTGLEYVSGPFLGSRLPVFFTVSGRAEAGLQLGSQGDWVVTAYLEVYNLFARQNVLQYFFEPDISQPSWIRRIESLDHKRLLNFGLRLDWGK